MLADDERCHLLEKIKGYHRISMDIIEKSKKRLKNYRNAKKI